MAIVSHLYNLYCKECLDMYHTKYKGELDYLWDEKHQKITGLKCPDCGKEYKIIEVENSE